MQKNADKGGDLLEISILQGAVENANEAFVTIDEQSRVIFFNRAAERMFGYRQCEVVGRDLAEILGPGCREGHQRAVAAYVKTRRGKLIGHASEFEAMRRNGEIFPASISFSLTEVDGRLFFTGIVRELTETKALHAQIMQAERLAALGQMVAEISHEIKNPLVMIGGFARQLKKKIKGEQEQDKLGIIVSEVERLEKLLADLKDLYRPRRLNLVNFDIDELLREVCNLTIANLKNDAITINCQAEPGAKMISGDRDKLKQVLLNLVKNGAEALAGPGTVAVASRLEGNSIKVTITDSGQGIPASIKEKIFSPFFTTKEHGTGLGLCVSKRIVDEHPGGLFSLESEEGRGTTVTITLPQLAGPCLQPVVRPGK
ncbi:MAG: ATP-binding protein [Thermodesulfobacteriota bacterium]